MHYTRAASVCVRLRSPFMAGDSIASLFFTALLSLNTTYCTQERTLAEVRNDVLTISKPNPSIGAIATATCCFMYYRVFFHHDKIIKNVEEVSIQVIMNR